MRGLLVVFTGWALVGCALIFPDGNPAGGTRNSSSSSSSGGAMDAGPDVLPVGPVITAQVDRAIDGAARAAFPLSGGRVLLDSADQLRLVEGDTTVVLPRTAGDLNAAVDTDVGVLVAGAHGFFVIVDGALVASPLSLEVDAATVLSLWNGDGEIWIQTSERLARFSGGQVRDVWVGQVVWANARLAWGGDFEGAPALWVVHGGTLTAVQVRNGQAQAWQVAQGFDAVDVVTDATGTVWLRSMDGSIHARAWDGHWNWYRLDAPADLLAGHPSAAEVWVGSAGSLTVFAEGKFRTVANMPMGTPRAVVASGRLVVSSAQQVNVVRARRLVTLTGLTEGMTLPGAMSLPVTSENASDMASVTVQVDDADEVALTLPANVDLNPNILGTGDHQVKVTVGYTGDALSSWTVVHFKVGALRDPTWTLDVQPLALARCDRCHGERGSAHRLVTSALWQDEITTILEAVGNGRMPLNSTPLSAGEIALIQRWSLAGFPE
jgi:hypothetical protein